MWENAYLSINNPKASRALKWALDPGRNLLASLARLRFAMSATFGLGPPLDQILDPHLFLNWNFRIKSLTQVKAFLVNVGRTPCDTMDTT